VKRIQLSKKRRKVLGVTVLAVLGVMCLAFTDAVATLGLQTTLSNAAQGLVDECMVRDFKTFAGMSGIKGGLAVLEGSSVGVGFQLEIGDLAQPLYDYVDFFWKALLYALVVLGFYKLLLEAGLLTVGLKVAGIGLLLLCAGWVRPQWRQRCMAWGRRCVALGILIAYVIPASLLCTHYASMKYIEPLRDRYDAQVQDVGLQLLRVRDEFIALKEEVTITQPSESLDRLKTRMTGLTQRKGNIVWRSFSAFVNLAIISMFELVVFPLVSALLLWKGARIVLDKLLETRPATKQPPEPAEGEVP